MRQSTPSRPVGSLPPAGRYLLDAKHTTVGFTAWTLGFPVRGRFTEVTGSVDIAQDPQRSQVTARVGARSLQSGSSRRDAHLMSSDFLDVAVHPVLRFRSTGFEASGDGWAMTGDLTIHGVTRPVAFDARCLDWSLVSRRLLLDATTRLNRSEFGVRSYRLLVADAVVVAIRAEAAPVIPAQEAPSCVPPCPKS